jgi:3-phosphoglycerate kinase
VKKKLRCCFCKTISGTRDIHVNDALEQAHRAHAQLSLHSFLKQKMFWIIKEIESLNKVLKNSENQ